MDILELLKQRLTPLYPQMAPQMPDQHGQIVAQGQQQKGTDWGQLAKSGLQIAGKLGGGAEAADKAGADAHVATDTVSRPDGLSGGLMGTGVSSTAPSAPAGGNSIAQAGQQVSSWLGGSSQPTAEEPMTPQDVTGQPAGDGTRPRVVPGQPVTGNVSTGGTYTPEGYTPIEPEKPALQRALTRREKIDADIAQIEGKDYTAPVYRDPNTGKTSNKERPGYVLETPAGKNYDKNHNIIDVLKGIGLGALQGGKQGGLAGLIGGAAGGGIAAGLDRNADDKMWDDFKLGNLQNDLAKQNEYETIGYKRDKAQGEAIEAQQKPVRENTKILADIQNNRAKLQQDALKESLGLKSYNPKDPRDRAIATQAGLNPDDIQAYDDRNLVERKLADGTSIKISGADAWKEEQTTARGDVAREQDITKFNANNQLEVQKKNVDNMMKFSDDVRTVLTETAKANAGVIAAAPEAQGFAQTMQINAASMSKAIQDGDNVAYDKAQSAFDAANKGYSAALGKAQGGEALVEQFKKAMPKRPERITYEPVKASSAHSKKVSQADIDAFAKSKGWTSKQAKDYANNNGWTIQ